MVWINFNSNKLSFWTWGRTTGGRKAVLQPTIWQTASSVINEDRPGGSCTSWVLFISTSLQIPIHHRPPQGPSIPHFGGMRNIHRLWLGDYHFEAGHTFATNLVYQNKKRVEIHEVSSIDRHYNSHVDERNALLNEVDGFSFGAFLWIRCCRREIWEKTQCLLIRQFWLATSLYAPYKSFYFELFKVSMSCSDAKPKLLFCCPAVRWPWPQP